MRSEEEIQKEAEGMTIGELKSNIKEISERLSDTKFADFHESMSQEACTLSSYRSALEKELAARRTKKQSHK